MCNAYITACAATPKWVELLTASTARTSTGVSDDVDASAITLKPMLSLQEVMVHIKAAQ